MVNFGFIHGEDFVTPKIGAGSRPSAYLGQITLHTRPFVRLP